MDTHKTAKVTDSTGTNWHQMGNKTTELMSIKDALDKGGLNFQVAKQPIIVLGNTTPFYATVRMDTKKTMGIVKEGYKIIQNTSAFDFFNPVIRDGEAIIERVGTLGKNAEKTFILARLPESYLLGEKDEHRTYILLTNDHSGNGTCLALPTDIRLACWNQMNHIMALGKKEQIAMVKIRHSGDVKAKLQEAHKVMLITREVAKANEARNNRLITLDMRAELASKMFDQLLDVKAEFGKKVEDINSTMKLNQKGTLMNLFANGKGADMFPNTAYNYLNAVTEFYDHHKSVRGNDKLSTVFVGGNGFRKKVEAEKQLLQYFSS